MSKSSESKEFTIAAAGDYIGGMRISTCEDESFLSLIKILRDADVAYTNLEAMIHNYEGPPGADSGGTWMRAPAFTTEELKWAGFDAVSCPTNHTCDYSYGGIMATMKALDEAGIAYAGIGTNLAEAREAKYFDTKNGRVAIISACSTYPIWGRAGDARRDMQGRPGQNPLRFYYVVDSETMRELQRVASKLHIWNQPYQNGREAHFFREGLTATRWKFVVGDKPGVSTKCDELDLKGNLASVKEASRKADYVLVTYHGHEGQGDEWGPATFQEEFARACIDAGANAFLGNGAHMLRGIEIYKNRPIFYSLGLFVVQSGMATRLPADVYELFGLGGDASPAELNEVRGREHGKEGYTSYFGKGVARTRVDVENHLTVIAHCTFEGGEITALKLYPVTPNAWSKSKMRAPFSPATGDLAEKTIRDLSQKSSQYGTKIEFRDGIGTVRLSR